MKLLRAIPVRVVVCAAAAMLAIVEGAVPALAQPAPSGNLVVLTDFVLGGAGLAPEVPSCVQLSQFSQGTAIIIRTRVLDGATGQELSDADLSSVQVTLDGGIVLNERYGGHPGGPGATVTDHFWSAAWRIPADYPTGAVQVAVTATANDGRTAAWMPFNVAASDLTVIPGPPPGASSAQ